MATNKSEIEVVAGAGGAKGLGLIGGFQACEERSIAVGKVTGVSAGSLMGAFYSNGYSAQELGEIYIGEELRLQVAEQFNSYRAWLNPLNRIRGVINLEPQFAQLVKRYNLKPNPRLRIIAFNIVTCKPVIFEGTQYNLAKALAASCAIPFIMRPVVYLPLCAAEQAGISNAASESMGKPGILVDGGVHHFNPSAYCVGPAIVFRLGTVTRLPSELPRLIESICHLGELVGGPLVSKLGLDTQQSDDDVFINVGSNDVGGVSFSASEAACRRMIEHGRRQAGRALDQAMLQSPGKIPLLGKVA